jgi:asparagine synthase (glutamine-hydrolysing)
MSGIAAVFDLDGSPAERATVERVLAVSPYRARDGSASWSDGPIALGHAMLHTTPESLHESQPLVDADGDLALVFTGRIDNRDELKTAFERAAIHPNGDSDAAYAMAAYQRWGDDFPAGILGDFAFALWDRKRRRMLCARDPLGVAALYYFTDGRVFLCASELHQLFAHPRVPMKPNEGMIAETLDSSPNDAEETLYQGIYRLPASFLFIVTRSGVARRRYYDLDPARSIEYRNDEEYAEHLRAIVFEAVRCRLRSHGRVLADLSGGLDSSSVVAVAAHLLKTGAANVDAFDTMTIDHDRPEADERRYVADAEDASQLKSHHLRASPRPLEWYRETARYFRDLPYYPNGAMIDFVAFFQSFGDVRVWLTGGGGDEFFGGSTYGYADMIRSLHLVALARRFRADLALRRMDPTVNSPFTLLYRTGVLPLVPKPLKQALKPLFVRDELPFSIAPDFARRTGFAERMRRQPPMPRCRDLAQQDIYRTYSAGWMAQALEPIDRYAAFLGVEARHPFYDRRVMEFACAIPEDQRLRDMETKFVLRRAMRGLLAPSILARLDKGIFGYAYPETLRAFGGEGIFASLEIENLGWVDGARVREAYRKMESLYRSGDLEYFNYIGRLWIVLAVEIWFSETFGRRSVSSAELRAAGSLAAKDRPPMQACANNLTHPAETQATTLKRN